MENLTETIDSRYIYIKKSKTRPVFNVMVMVHIKMQPKRTTSHKELPDKGFAIESNPKNKNTQEQDLFFTINNCPMK